MPLIEPLAADHDAEVAELARFFNETLGARGWSPGRRRP
jgi:hypothetical protein